MGLLLFPTPVAEADNSLAMVVHSVLLSPSSGYAYLDPSFCFSSIVNSGHSASVDRALCLHNIPCLPDKSIGVLVSLEHNLCPWL